jgi:hypothetical protein
MSNRRKAKASAFCADCGIPTIWRGRSEWYMVHDDLWQAADISPVPDMETFLCVGCIEERLGRQLTAADFTDVPANVPGPGMSPRLRNRLATPPDDGSDGDQPHKTARGDQPQLTAHQTAP